MLAAPLAAAFFLSVTFSWDEFIIAFLLTRFDVTLPVEIWSMLKSGLSPATNAVGSLVFLVSVTLVILLELTVFRRPQMTAAVSIPTSRNATARPPRWTGSAWRSRRASSSSCSAPRAAARPRC